jgi:hypothetical protein
VNEKLVVIIGDGLWPLLRTTTIETRTLVLQAQDDVDGRVRTELGDQFRCSAQMVTVAPP